MYVQKKMSGDIYLLILLALAGTYYYYHYNRKEGGGGSSTGGSAATNINTAAPSASQQAPSLSAADVKQQEAQRSDMRRKLADQPVQRHEIVRVPADQVAQFIHVADNHNYSDDILHLPQYAKARGDAGKILELKRICTARTDCKAFNTEGFVKRGQNGMVNAKPQAGIDIYLRI